MFMAIVVIAPVSFVLPWKIPGRLTNSRGHFGLGPQKLQSTAGQLHPSEVRQSLVAPEGCPPPSIWGAEGNERKGRGQGIVPRHTPSDLLSPAVPTHLQ